MSKATQVGDFFVVGGPVQAGRECYVARKADEELLSGIADQRFCYVLCSPGSGKSSLMARTIRTLRGEGQLAAVVDLTQIGARGEAADPGRWYYSIAYRIVRDLRIKVDLQYWWQEKSALLGDQRLVEFFWEVVLTHTTAPVTIFIDEAERGSELRFATELFSAIRTCYLQRATEPDYGRLNFVVLGVATPAQLSPNAAASPFVDGQAIDLPDFSLAECYELGAGFEADETVSHALMDRIYAWTSGQPYLTQKIARAVARKGGKLADVERVVHDLLLAPRASQEEPHLNHIRALLAERAPVTRQVLARLVKLAKGTDVQDEHASAAVELLLLAGIVRRDAGGALKFSNRIYARVFDERWAKSEMPVNWRAYAAAAAGLAVAIWLPYWYTQVLPRPYIETLSGVTQDYAVAEAAYARLARLPFFGATADRLLADVTVRRSRSASTIAEALAADTVARDSLGNPSLADELMAEYWLRQSRVAMHRGDRDAALLYAIEADRAAPAIAASAAAELLDSDYARLVRTFRLAQAPLQLDVDWENDELVIVERTRRVAHASLAAAGAAASEAQDARTASLTAFQHVPVTRDLFVEDDVVAGEFELSLMLRHPSPTDLELTLRAPSGTAATFAVSESAGERPLVLSARADSPLGALADEPALGRWQLTLVDRQSGAEGTLSEWGLRFGANRSVWRDVPEQGIALPDPFRSEQVDIALSPGGRVAIAQPTRSGSAQLLAVWDLHRNKLVADLPLRAATSQVAVSSRTQRVLALSSRTATLWDFQGTRIARLETRGEFAPRPALSGDEDFAVLAETSANAPARFSLLDMTSGDVLASFAGVATIRDWALGPRALYLAVLDGARRALILDPHTGEARGQLRHHRDLVRVVPATGDTLVTVDADGAIQGWRIAPEEDAADFGTSWVIGTTVDAASVDVAASADEIAFALADGLVAVQDLRGARQPQYVRAGDGLPSFVRIAPGGDRLVTAYGSVARLWDIGLDAPLSIADRDVSAALLDAGGEIAVFGYAGGHVRVRAVGELERRGGQEDVDYIGHRGAVTSLAVNTANNLIASGGVDGVVRIWNLRTVAPTPALLRHPSGPIRALTLSADGTAVISAGDYSARIWATQTGELIREIAVDGAALAVTCAPSMELFAVGDSAGDIFLAPLHGTAPPATARAHAAVLALAISADAKLMVSGDAAGNLQLWDTALPETSRATHLFTDPVSWVAFGASGTTVLAKSGAWIHALEIHPTGFTVTASRLLPIRLGPATVPVQLDGGLRWLSHPAASAPRYEDLSFEGSGAESAAPDPALLARDWPAILGLDLDRATGTVRATH
ncbi:MAG TPA: AAA-like domain-containing protein [Gammaproteobacteria bacterium]